MKIREVTKHGNRRWEVNFGTVGGKMRRQYFKTQGAAESALDAAKRDRRKVGNYWANLPAKERAEVVLILEDIAKAGKRLADVWFAFKHGGAGGPVSVTVQSAIAAIISAKRKANRRGEYVDSLEHFLNRFGQSVGFNRMIADITADEIKAFLGAVSNLSSRETWQSRICTLFAFAERNQWINRNPCLSLEPITKDAKTPIALTARAAGVLLRLALTRTPDVLAYITLGLFCGLRPTEATRLTWDKIDLKAGTVTLDGFVTKTRHRRITPIPPNAIAWLKKCRRRKGMICPSRSTLRRRLRFLRRRFNAKRIPADILRHTAASHLLAREQDVGRVATWLGNSPSVLQRHYVALVAKQSSDEYFSLTPNKRPL